MSSAATIHDGCGSLVHLLMLCIILIVICVLGMQPLHMYLYLTFVAHSYGKRAKMAEVTANLPFGEFFRGRFAKQLC